MNELINQIVHQTGPQHRNVDPQVHLPINPGVHLPINPGAIRMQTVSQEDHPLHRDVHLTVSPEVLRQVQIDQAISQEDHLHPGITQAPCPLQGLVADVVVVAEGVK